MEYALKYQQHLKGLIISNMMSSIPTAYNEYANTVLMPAMDQKVLAEVKALEAQETSAIHDIWNCCCRRTTRSTSSGCRPISGPTR